MTQTRYGLTPPSNTYRDTIAGQHHFREWCAYHTPRTQLADVLVGWCPPDVDSDDVGDWVHTRPLDHPVHNHLFLLFGDRWMMTEQYGRHDAVMAGF